MTKYIYMALCLCAGWAAQATCSTPFTQAAKLGHTERVQAALTDGVDVNMRNCRGATALHEAARMGRQDVVRVLIQHKNTNTNVIDYNARTPLFYAASQGNIDIFMFLVEAGALLRPSIMLGALYNKKMVLRSKRQIRYTHPITQKLVLCEVLEQNYPNDAYNERWIRAEAVLKYLQILQHANYQQGITYLDTNLLRQTRAEVQMFRLKQRKELELYKKVRWQNLEAEIQNIKKSGATASVCPF